MSPVTNALSETQSSSSSRKVAEKRRTSSASASESPSTLNNTAPQNTLSADRLDFIKSYFNKAMADAFSARDEDAAPASSELSAYDQAGETLTPQNLADQIFSRTMSHFPQYRDNHPHDDAQNVLRSFVADVRKTFDSALHHVIDVMAALNVLNQDSGQALKSLKSSFNTSLKGIEPPPAEISADDLAAALVELDL
jgi:hypothetical protein